MENKEKTFVEQCRDYGIVFDEWVEDHIHLADIHNDTVTKIFTYAGGSNATITCFGKGFKTLFTHSFFSSEVKELVQKLMEGQKNEA